VKDNNFQSLIPDIYEASTDIEGWTSIADRLSDLFGSAGVGVVDQPLTPSGQIFSATSRFEQTMRDRHFEEFNTPETNLGLALVVQAPLGMPTNMLAFVDQKTFEDHASTRALLRPQEIDKTLFVTLERNENLLSFAILFRRIGQPDFDETDTKNLAELSRHIKKSHKFRRLLHARDEQRDAAKHRASRSHIAHGLVILNMKGAVLDADAGAEAIFEEPDGLQLRNGRLSLEASIPPLDGNDLQAFAEMPPEQAAPLAVRTRDGAIIVLEHLPVPVSDPHVAERLCRFLTIKRIRTSVAPETVAFSKAYNLTKAEARVVDALSHADNASDAARSIGISRDTMKSHLSRIYGKTGINSLPQLMLLIGRLS
jgi:DNA-binding CsgD family transcriptional regulator